MYLLGFCMQNISFFIDIYVRITHYGITIFKSKHDISLEYKFHANEDS